MEDGELNSLIEGLNNANQSGQLVLTQQIQQQNPPTHFVVSPYPTNTFISTSESPFPTPSPSPSIILRSPAPVKSPIAHLQNIKSPIPVKSPGFQNVKSPTGTFQNVKSPTGNFQNVKSPYQVKSPVSNIKSPASGVVKSPANIRSPGVCNPQSPAQAHSPFQHQVVGSPNSNRSPAPPPPTPSPTAPSPARPNTPQPVVTQYPPIAPNTNQLVQLLQQPGQLVGRAQIIPGAQNAILKTKQPQQILPKPLPPSTSPHKQSVPRLNTAMQQQTPLLINQTQTPSPTLVLNQVLTSGAPVLVQPAGPGGTVHLMLRPPTPTLQSGPGPPQNKMIITNATQPQPQAVLIQNRQQVMRIMTAQGPMQLQQIQTPSGPQFIAIPQNQALSFPPNSVLLQSPATNTIQVQQNASTLQLQQNAANALQLQQNASTILQSNTFQQNALPITQNQISLQNQILQTNAANSSITNLNKEKVTADNSVCIPGANEQKKIVIDNKVNNNFNSNFNSNKKMVNSTTAIVTTTSCTTTTISPNNNNNVKKINKSVKTKNEEEAMNKNVNKNFAKVDNLISNPVSVPTSTNPQKNITSSLRQIRPGAFANRNKQNQNTEAKDKIEDASSKNLNNLTRIIDSVASNTEHLISPPNSAPPTKIEMVSAPSKVEMILPTSKVEMMPKVDNLTATINSVAENIKSPTPDEIMSNLSLTDVFISGNKTLSLNKRPNLTIVQKQNKIVQPDSEEPTLTINRLILSPNSGSGVDFASISEGYEGLELGGVMTSASVQTTDGQVFIEQSQSSQTMFQSPDDSKKGKKKAGSKKKGKKEENRVDLWDLMKSAGIGDDEFDEPTEINTFSQDTGTVTEGLEISASDTELLAQLQSAQLPGGIRVVIGEDGRPVIINGNNVLIPEPVHSSSTGVGTDPTDAESVLQNMILPENVFNFSPQALAAAQTQLNQLIQEHGNLTTSSADQQLLSQIIGSSSNNLSSSGNNGGATVMHTTATNTLSSMPPQSISVGGPEPMILSATNNESTQATLVQKQEVKSEFIGGPPPGLPPLGPDSLVITNNNGVPTLVASPALMQYLQTHQGIIQFQHDPVTKTIQPSLIIPHPQHKIENSTPPQEIRTDKTTAVTVNSITRTANNQSKENVMNKQRNEMKSSVGTITEDPKNNLGSLFNILGSNQMVPNIVKLNMAKIIRENPPLLQIASETNNLITIKESNKNLTDKEIVEIDKKIQENRIVLDQCLQIEARGGLQVNSGGLQNVILKESGNKDNIIYQVGNFGLIEKSNATVTNKTTETQTLEDLQNLDMTLIKNSQATPYLNSPTPNSDFQTKFLEAIGMATTKPQPKSTVSVGTGTNPSPVSASALAPAPVTTATPAKRGRKKKNEKIQNQATQADTKPDVPAVCNIPQLTPEQNVKLNQALHNRGVTGAPVDFEAIKQIIQEEIRKITASSLPSANLKFVNAASFVEEQDIPEPNMTSTNIVLNNPNLNQLLEQPTHQGNIISLQGNELVTINNGNQQIFTSQNQLLSSGHFVTSNNQILAIGGNHNQLVSLGNPINSSNQIVTLGSPSNLVSVNGNNVPQPGSVIVGSNGNVVAIVHQTPVSGQGSNLVQRVQTIQLTTPKQQHFKTLQSQIQTLSSKANRTPTEQSNLQKLLLEQQKILSTGKLVTTIPGQHAQGMQIVSQSLQNQPTTRIFQQQSPQQTSQQLQLSQQQSLQPQQQQIFVTTNANISSTQPCKTSFTTHTAVSCGTSTSDFNGTTQQNIPKLSVPPSVVISDPPTSNYGPLYVSPNTSGKNVTKCEKGTSPIQIQMGTQTMANLEYRSGKMSTGTMTSPNTGKPQAVVAPAIVIQQAESPSPTWQMKPRNQQPSMSPMRNQVPTISRTAFIEQQMRTDQAGATMPDTRTPFLSKSDACKRLIRYHCMDEKALSPQDLATADDIFEATAQHLLDKFRAMKEKYKYLLMLESMREVSTAERIMVDRNFIIEERTELEELREKEKRLQEEFENPTISYPISADIISTETNTFSNIKTELLEEENSLKVEPGLLINAEDVKCEKSDSESDKMISKFKINSDNYSDSTKDNPFKLTEANRNFELTKIKSETKECKNTRTSGRGSDENSRSVSPQDDISSKCKAKSTRTFSDGSSKSSLDSSKDEDSGTDINAQVQSAIDSILNLQKCETMSNSPDDGSSSKRSKKRRKFGEKTTDGTKRLKVKGFGGRRERSLSDDSDDDDGCGSDADPILDEAIRSILTS